jgi:hypothetical protein
MYFNRHRSRFDILYHEPPARKYFRSYRVEVDYQEDIELMREIHKNVGIYASLHDVVTLLDTRPDLVEINMHCHEKTGLLTSYSNAKRREWYKLMRRQDVVMNSGNILRAAGRDPVFCSGGLCRVGDASGGVLVTGRGDRISGEAYVSCDCGAGLFWHNKL